MSADAVPALAVTGILVTFPTLHMFESISATFVKGKKVKPFIFHTDSLGIHRIILSRNGSCSMGSHV